jgi:Zn ribbon nucleic-acid-binding protein
MRRFIVTAVCVAASASASAHDWYEDRVDPQTRFKCCGGADCRAIPRSSVQSRINGGYIYLPHGFNIPRSRVQESEDNQYHICEGTYVVTNQLYLRCFFAPRADVSLLLPR